MRCAAGERTIALAGTAVLLLLCAGRASAGPRVELVTSGDCPGDAVMRDSLSSVVEVVESGASWRVEVARRGARADLTVLRDGTPVLRRTIESKDCRAVARAIAVILHAHFAVLAMPPEPPAETEAAPAGEGSEPPQPGGVAMAGEAARPPVTPPAPVRVASAAPVRAAGDTAIVRAAERTPSRGADLELGASAGLAAPASPAGMAAFAQLDGGAALGRAGLGLRAVLALHSADQQQSGEDRVALQQSSAALGLGWRMERGPLWVRPAVLAGAVLWRVTALDLEGSPEVRRVQPIVELAAAGGVAITRRASVRLDVALTGYPAADRYLIEPVGEVARSPRAVVAAGLGMEWRSRE